MKVVYTAKNYNGQSRGGEMVVKDERDLANQLRAEGFILTSFEKIEEEKSNKVQVKFVDRFYSIPLKEKMMMVRNLSVMIASGLPLSRAIRGIALQAKNKKLIKILNDIQENIQSGANFSDSLVKYPGVFGDLFVNMIRVGESSGNLEETLQILANQLEKEHELISKVRGAFVYPSVIVVAMIGIGVIMMIYVVPQITGVFADLNAELPATTQFIIATSDFLRNHYIISLALVIFLVLGLKVLTMFQAGKKIINFIMINAPLMKNIIIKVNCARFARIYSSLLKSGVPITETLRILSRTLTNYYYQKALIRAVENIQKGVNLSKIIYKENKIFPLLVPQMIEIGEETGKTETVLMKLAEFYEGEVDQISKNLSSIIEPVLMLIIGGAVGFFAISMLQPMYSVMASLK
jgi:type IV pilus assembly protein PilC